jgi:hypothetical protein
MSSLRAGAAQPDRSPSCRDLDHPVAVLAAVLPTGANALHLAAASSNGTRFAAVVHTSCGAFPACSLLAEGHEACAA